MFRAFVPRFRLGAISRKPRSPGKRRATRIPFYANKLVTGKFFLARMLPDTKSHLAKLKTGAEPLMTLAAEAF